MKESIECSFTIHCPGSLLWWIISIAFLGSAITGIMMIQAGRFMLTDKSEPVSLQGFHRIGSQARALALLSSMNASARRSMRNGLNTDYFFMPFFYGLLVCLSLLVSGSCERYSGWEDVLRIMCWLPAGMWAFDLIENLANVALLARFEDKQEISSGNVVVMAVATWLKWGLGAVWTLLMLSHIMTRVIAYWNA